MSSPNKTWTVVCFIADETVEAVPTRWINGDECLWPAVTREKLNILIKKCEFNSCWPSHKVRTFRNATYDVYGVARAKASKAELTSDLNTDDGESITIPEKRIRRKKVFSSSESEENEPPVETKKKKVRKIQNLPHPPIWTNDVELNINAEENNNCDDNFKDANLDVSDSQQTTSFIRDPLLQVQSTSSPRTPVQFIKENMNKTSKSCCCNQKLLYNIQSLLIEINSKVSNCKNAIGVEQNHVSILEKSQMEFPISTMEHLMEFDKFLTIPENFTALVQYFAKLGGNNTYELIRRCIAPIVDDSLAEQFSFLGKKGKNTFGTTLLAKAIIEGAQKSGHASNNKETEQKIGDWLRRAKERNLRAHIRKNSNRSYIT